MGERSVAAKTPFRSSRGLVTDRRPARVRHPQQHHPHRVHVPPAVPVRPAAAAAAPGRAAAVEGGQVGVAVLQRDARGAAQAPTVPPLRVDEFRQPLLLSRER